MKFRMLLAIGCVSMAFAAMAVEYTITNELNWTVPSDATKVTKEGSATASLGADTTANKAEYHIKEGMLIAPTSTLRLGPGNPIVRVEEGATLWSSNMAVKGESRMELHLKGTVDFTPSGSYGRTTATFLEGDNAKVVVRNQLAGIWQGQTLAMDGHPLRVEGSGARKHNTYGSLGVGFAIWGYIRNNADFSLGPDAELVLCGDNVQYAGTKSVKTITADNGSEVLACPCLSGGYTTTAKNPIPYGITAAGDVYVTSLNQSGTPIANYRGANTWMGPMKINKGGKLTVWTRDQETMLFARGIDGPGTFNKIGDASLFVTGKVNCAINTLTVGASTMSLEDGVNLSVTNSDSTIQRQISQLKDFVSLPRLMVDEKSAFSMPANIGLTLGGSGSSYGVMDVTGKAGTTNVAARLKVGASGNGHLRVFGGNFLWQGRYTQVDAAFADAATSYSTIVVTNGNVRCSTDVGLYANAGSSTIRIEADSGLYPDYSCVFGNGYHNLYLAGKMFNKNSIYTARNLLANSTGGMTLTLDGPNADFGGGYAFYADNTSGGGVDTKYVTQVNINNGGRFYPNNFGKNQNPAERNNKLYVTADGGTYRRTSRGDYIGVVTDSKTGVTNHWGADKFVVYPGGLTFQAAISGHSDSNWKVRVDTPIEGPTGWGVTNVTLPQAILDRRDYPGPAKLTIVTKNGSQGAGFTAICEYEPISDANNNRQYGRVTGVKVTCPGWGYAEGDITVKVHYPIHTLEPEVCEVAMAENDRSGGLTKTGNSYLLLASKTNSLGQSTYTYGGVTYIKEGTLDVDNGVLLPEGTPIRAAHNTTLCLRNSHTLNSMNIEGHLHTAGPGTFTITNSLTVNAAQLMSNQRITAANSYKFTGTAKLVVKNPEELTERVSVIMPEAASTSITLPSGGLPVVDESGNAIRTLKTYVEKDATSQKKIFYLEPVKGLAILFN